MGRLLLLTMAVFGFSLSGEALAQHIESPQNAGSADALAKAISLYDREVSRNTMLYSGISYYDSHSNILGHQFFGEDYWEQGTVDYDGQHYDSIFLKYDIYRDQLLIENFNSDGFLSPIIIYQKRVDSFMLMNHHFIKIEGDTAAILRTGYYDLMYHGDDLQFLVRRRKDIVDSNEISTIREEFLQKDRYYIKKGTDYYRFRKKGALLKLLKDRKKELKTFIRGRAMQFALQPDVQFAELIQYYDSLP